MVGRRLSSSQRKTPDMTSRFTELKGRKRRYWPVDGNIIMFVLGNASLGVQTHCNLKIYYTGLRNEKDGWIRLG